MKTLLLCCLFWVAMGGAQAQSAWQFDGIDDYAQVADYPALQWGTQPFTLEVSISDPDFSAGQPLTIPYTITTNAPITLNLNAPIHPLFTFVGGDFQLNGQNAQINGLSIPAGQTTVNLVVQANAAVTSGSFNFFLQATVTASCGNVPAPILVQTTVNVQPQINVSVEQTVVQGFPNTYVSSGANGYRYVTIRRRICATGTFSGNITCQIEASAPSPLWQLMPPNVAIQNVTLTPNSSFGAYCTEINYTYRIPKNASLCDIEVEFCVRAEATTISNCKTADRDCLVLPGSLIGLPNIIPASVTTFSQAIQQNLLTPFASSAITPQNLLIKGRLEQDIPLYTFGGDGSNFSDIKMGAGAEIVVPSTVPNSTAIPELRLQGVHVHAGCGVLWRSITVENHARLTCTASPFNANFRTIINDALYAIDIRGKASLRLISTTFDRNYIGVHVPDVPGLSHGVNFAVFSNNIFRGSASLLNDYPNIPEPVNNRWSYAGMRMHRQSVLVIPNTAAINIFENIANGILAYQTNSLNLSQCRFLNIQPNGYTGTSGNGIYVDGGNNRGVYELIQRGQGNSALSPASFNNCLHGIRAIHCRLDIQANNMVNMGRTGVESLAAGGLSILVSENRMVVRNMSSAGAGFASAGIRMWLNDASASPITITTNEITIGNSQQPTANTMADAGIALYELGTAHPVFIRNNHIVVKFALHGIFANGNTGALIEQNNIDIERILFLPIAQIPERFGIRIRGGGKVEVKSNNVEGITPNNNMQVTRSIGIGEEMCIDGHYACNFTNKTNEGLRFIGASGTNNIIEGNDMKVHRIGLHYGTQAVTGPQNNKNNFWSNPLPYNSWGAIHDEPSIANISIYTVWGQGTFLLPPTYTPIDWFNPNGAFTIIPCTQTLLSSGDGINDTDNNVAQGNMQGASNATQWHLRTGLYHKLHKNPQWMQQSPLMQQFYNSYQSQTIAAVVNAEEHRNDATVLDSPNMSQRLVYQQLLRSKSDSIAYLDSLYALGILTESVWENQRLQQHLQIETLAQEAEVFGNGFFAQCQQKCQMAEAVNLGIVPTNAPENNEQTVNEIYLQTVALGNLNFSPAQIQTLHDIANQCPLLHGKAVYNARSLYALIDNVVYEDNCPTQPQAKSTEVCHHKDVSFVNPSLEGILGHFLTPPQGWVVCEQSVDFMPISLNSTEFAMASDGQMYTHLFSTYPAPEAYREAVGQELGGTLQSGELYMFSVDLSYNFQVGADTGILSISLGDSLCHRGQVIYHQEVDDFAWTPHVIEFVPNKDYKYIIFSSEVDSSKYTGGNMIIGNVIMDNLRNVRCGVNATGTEAVEEADDNYFLLYPNPNATGQLTVEWASPIAVKLRNKTLTTNCL